MTFEEIMNTFPAASDYLSTIYLIKRDYGTVSNSRLASWLEVSRPAVTQAVSRLKKLELITQERYADIEMTSSGIAFAKKMLRRHYLLEHFLMDHLSFEWHEIDEEAKRLQNSISNNFEEKMYAVLGKPSACPHGNPIPDDPREKEILAALNLTYAEPGMKVEFMRITEEGEEKGGLLDFIYKHGIELHDRFEILDSNSNGYHIRIHSPEGQLRHEDILIPEKYCKFLCYLT